MQLSSGKVSKIKVFTNKMKVINVLLRRLIENNYHLGKTEL